MDFDMTTMLLQMDQKLPSDNFCNDFNSKTLSFSDHFSPNLELSPQSNGAFQRNSMAAMREMIFQIAAMQPIYIDPESVKPPKRRNVRISKDPQSVAARHRRERISEKIRILQRLVPGGTKMDTASMLDEAVHYVKFLKKQVAALEQARGLGFSGSMIENQSSKSLNCANLSYSSALLKACQQPPMVGSLQMH